MSDYITGNETQLSDCPHDGFGNVSKCKDRGHYAGVICFDETGKNVRYLRHFQNKIIIYYIDVHGLGIYLFSSVGSTIVWVFDALNKIYEII